MSDLSNYFEDAILNTMRSVSLTSFTAYAALLAQPTGATVTYTNATNLVNLTAHSFTNGDIVTLVNSGGSLPTGLVAAVKYYVVNADTNDFQISLFHDSLASPFSDDGSGTNTVHVFIDESGSGQTELTGLGYARLSITFGAPTTVDDTRQIANTSDLEFTASGGDWDELSTVAIYDALTVGNLIAANPVTPVVINDTNIYRLATGNITVQMN